VISQRAVRPPLPASSSAVAAPKARTASSRHGKAAGDGWRKRIKTSTCTPIATSTKPARWSATMPPRSSSPGQRARKRLIEIDRPARHHGFAGHRHGGVSINPFWSAASATSPPDREDPEREARRALRLQARGCSFCLADLQGPISRCRNSRPRSRSRGLKGRDRRQGWMRRGVLRP